MIDLLWFHLRNGMGSDAAWMSSQLVHCFCISLLQKRVLRMTVTQESKTIESHLEVCQIDNSGVWLADARHMESLDIRNL